MKKTYAMITAVIVLGGFTACNNPDKEMAKQNAENLTMYVDSVENATPVYTKANWTEIDNGYNERVSKVDNAMDKLDAETKTNAEISKAKFEALKADYEARIKEAEARAAAPDYRMVLRNKLFGEGKIGADMKFEFVTAANIHDVYKHFVDAVDEGKKEFTREDWDEIKVLYEALDSRKNTVEKEGLTAADNLKIAGLKVKFSAIKSTHRGVTKITENEKAKS